MRNAKIQNPYPPITSSAPISQIVTKDFFRPDHKELNLSPIDQYFENNKSLNLIANREGLNREMSSIVLLGYMSAVESYLRGIFREVIGIDEHSQKLVESMDIPYAAAIYHKGHLLPDALFENSSLANPKNIKDALKDFIGIKGNPPSDVDKVLKEFSKICELRHCCVHRFGKLGARNAVRLGLSEHHKFLEMPLHINQANLENISFILRSLVNTINRFIFESLLDRMAKNTGDQGQRLYTQEWTWNYNRDRKRFLSYYTIFSSIEDSSPSPPPKTIYDVYRNNYCT